MAEDRSHRANHAARARPDRLRGLVPLALALLVAIVAACSKRETQLITPWLRVDVIRPRADDMIRVGRRAEVFEIRRNGRWERLGVGIWSRYLVADEGAAVLVDLNDRTGLQLLLPDGSARPIPASFGRAGTVSVPSTSAVDVFVRENERQADIYRYDLSGRQIEHFRITVPDAFSDCSVVQAISVIDMDGTPYTTASCKSDSLQAKCLMLGPGGFVYAVQPDAEWSDCGDFGKAGISVLEPARFTVLE